MSLFQRHNMEQFVPPYLQLLSEQHEGDLIAMLAPLEALLQRYAGRLEELLAPEAGGLAQSHAGASNNAFDNTSFMQGVRHGFVSNHTGAEQGAMLNWIIGFKEINGGLYNALSNMCMRMRDGKPLVREIFGSPRLPSLAEWHEGHREYSLMMHHMNQHLARLYKSQVWQRNAVLTAPMKALYNFQHNADGKGRPGFTKVSTPNRLLFPGLDYFGNHIQQLAQYLRHIAFNFKCTRDILILRFGCSYDAFRQEWNLHFHCAFFGPPSASKSHSTAEAVKMCVDGTVVQTTDQSALADTVNEDLSDRWSPFDEVPISIVRQNGSHDDDPSTSRIKSILTECVLSRRVLALGDKDSRGHSKRTTQIIRTNVIQCISLSSNVSMDQIPSAVRSRLYTSTTTAISSSSGGYQTIDEAFADVQGQKDKGKRLGEDEAAGEDEGAQRASGSSTGGSRGRARKNGPLLDMPKVSPTDVQMTTMGNRERSREAQELKNAQIMQFMVANINKFIYVGMLPEPNMEVAHRIVFRLLRYLRKKGKITNTSVRDYQRIIIMARSLTIVNAILTTFHNEYTAYYAGREFDLEDLLQVKPHLVCTKQIAIFAFTLLQEQYVAPMEAAVIASMMKLAKYPHEGLAAKKDAKTKPAYSALFDDSAMDVDAIVDSIGSATAVAPPGQSATGAREERTEFEVRILSQGMRDMALGGSARASHTNIDPVPGVGSAAMEVGGEGEGEGEGESEDENGGDNLFDDDMFNTPGGGAAPAAAPDTEEDPSSETPEYKTPEEWYRDQASSRNIQWRYRINGGADGAGDGSAGKRYIDLNYVTLHGDLDKIANTIVNTMTHRYSVDDVRALLKEKSRESIEVPDAYEVVDIDQIVNFRIPQRKATLNVVEIEPDQFGHPAVHILICAMGQIVSHTLIEEAVRSLVHKQMTPQTYLLGTMNHMDRPDLGLFDTLTITEEDVASAKHDDFMVISPVYMPEKLRRMMFVDVTQDPDELDYDPQTNTVYQTKASFAAQAFTEKRGVSYEADYHEGRSQKVLAVDTDLDDWAFAEHFVRAGVPLRYDLETREYTWIPYHIDPTTATEAQWEPLPTPHNLLAKHRRCLLKDAHGRRRLEYVYNGRRMEPRQEQALPPSLRPTLALGAGPTSPAGRLDGEEMSEEGSKEGYESADEVSMDIFGSDE